MERTTSIAHVMKRVCNRVPCLTNLKRITPVAIALPVMEPWSSLLLSAPIPPNKNSILKVHGKIIGQVNEKEKGIQICPDLGALYH